MMTKRDFEAIAETIASLEPEEQHDVAPGLDLVLRETVAHAFAGICATSNPAFDRARFLRACGLED